LVWQGFSNNIKVDVNFFLLLRLQRTGNHLVQQKIDEHETSQI